MKIKTLLCLSFVWLMSYLIVSCGDNNHLSRRTLENQDVSTNKLSEGLISASHLLRQLQNFNRSYLPYNNVLSDFDAVRSKIILAEEYYDAESDSDSCLFLDSYYRLVVDIVDGPLVNLATNLPDTPRNRSIFFEFYLHIDRLDVDLRQKLHDKKCLSFNDDAE